MSVRDVARWRRNCHSKATVAGVAAAVLTGFACGVVYAVRGNRPGTPAS